MCKETVVFIGHRECFGLKESDLKRAIEQCVLDRYPCFLNGGMGKFDWMTARCVFELKRLNPSIRSILVIPYLDFSIPEPKLFDEIVFPEVLERCRHKAAIPQRNRYMVKHASAAICCIDHAWGGAARTYQLARKKQRKIINPAAKPV